MQQGWAYGIGCWLSFHDIKLANTVRNLGVCLDHTLPSQEQICSVRRICYLEPRLICAIRHYLSEDVTKKLL